MTERAEAIARLRSMMAAYPCLDADTERVLAGMHWRARRAVVLMYGERLTQREVARRLGVSRATVSRDLCQAAESMMQMRPMMQD